MLVELCNSLSDRNKFIPVGEIQPIAVSHERYVSVFPFANSIIEWIDKNKTIVGHRDKHSLVYIPVDIDNEKDISAARQSAVDFSKKLFNDYGLSSDDLFIYFSGNKGFHICISDKTIGMPQPSVDMADKCKLFIAEITKGISNIDFKIYENHRILRMENSLNEKSSLYKIQLSYEEIEKHSVEEIKRKAIYPRRSFKRKKNYSDILLNEKLVSIWQRISLNEKTETKYSEGFFSPPEKGERDNKLFKQAAMLFDKSVLNEYAVFEILRSINIASAEPLTDNDLRRIIRSAKQKTKDNAKPLELTEDEIVVKSIGGWSKEWYENLLPGENELTLGFSKFDNELRGHLRGKLGVILGYGGTKKSLYVKNIAKHNAERNLCILYSMMEMGISDTINRFVNMKVDGETENAIFALERMEKLERGKALSLFSEQIASAYGESILITFNSSMTCEKYEKTIEKTIRETGKPDILIVDGLSMMGGEKNETERYSANSKQLKDLANKYNILVLLICHSSKGAEKHTRDLSRLIRSSEKILDNCDFYINFSLIVDAEKTTNEITEYRNDKGYARLVNKRGSGKSINTIFDFNPVVLHLIESNEDPRNFEVKRKQKSILDL